MSNHTVRLISTDNYTYRLSRSDNKFVLEIAREADVYNDPVWTQYHIAGLEGLLSHLEELEQVTECVHEL